MATKVKRARRKVATKAAPPARKKFGKKTYTKVACSKTKTAANAKAKSLRKAGKAARVVKNPLGGACVYAASSKRKVTKVAAVGKPRRRRVVKRRK